MNFKHLHYFWVTAKAGGIMRAGEQLHTTPQTLSGQIKLLEEWLGRSLFRKSGRKLELTDDGRLALGYAEQIFTLGAELEAAVRQARGGQQVLEFRVGVADSVANGIEGLSPELKIQLHLDKLKRNTNRYTEQQHRQRAAIEEAYKSHTANAHTCSTYAGQCTCVYIICHVHLSLLRVVVVVCSLCAWW